jgi:hypothetical protein
VCGEPKQKTETRGCKALPPVNVSALRSSALDLGQMVQRRDHLRYVGFDRGKVLGHDFFLSGSGFNMNKQTGQGRDSKITAGKRPTRERSERSGHAVDLRSALDDDACCWAHRERNKDPASSFRGGGAQRLGDDRLRRGPLLRQPESTIRFLHEFEAFLQKLGRLSTCIVPNTPPI